MIDHEREQLLAIITRLRAERDTAIRERDEAQEICEALCNELADRAADRARDAVWDVMREIAAKHKEVKP